MKKLLLFILLFIPFIVFAKDGVSIEKLEYVDKSDTTEILEDATFNDLSININLRFHKIEDFVKYKITIKNENKKDYDLSSEESITKYVKLRFEGIEDNEKILKANSTKSFYLIIYYATEVPVSEYKDGSTIVSEEIKSIDLSPLEKNPFTSTGIIVITLVIASSIVFIFLINKKVAIKYTMVLLILSVIIIPLKSIALEKITLDVNAKVEIKHTAFYINDKFYLFDEGMTWEDFLISDYNVDNWVEREYSGWFEIVQNPNDLEPGINYYYFENGKKGIGTNEDVLKCGAYQRLGSYYVIKIAGDNTSYAYTDDFIIDGFRYNIEKRAC